MEPRRLNDLGYAEPRGRLRRCDYRGGGEIIRRSKPGALSTSCPSTTGGIDGTGGVYFATVLCGGTYVGACEVNHPTGYTFGIDIPSSNWAVEGWLVSEGYASGHSGFGFTANTGTAQRHHIAFINDVATFNASGFTTNSVGANSGAGNGLDYFAVVGDIAQNSAGRNDGYYDGGHRHHRRQALEHGCWHAYIPFRKLFIQRPADDRWRKRRRMLHLRHLGCARLFANRCHRKTISLRFARGSVFRYFTKA